MNNIFKSIKHPEIILVLIIIILLLHLRNTNNEGFTPYLKGIYRPHVRNFRIKYKETFDTYSPEYITTKLKRMNLY